MRPIITLFFLACAMVLCAQRPELANAEQVHDSVMAAIGRELAAGLWAEDIANGSLNGAIDMEITVNDKGKVETVFPTSSTLPIAWKNTVKDRWMNAKFDFKLAKYHKEKVTINLRFP